MGCGCMSKPKTSPRSSPPRSDQNNQQPLAQSAEGNSYQHHLLQRPPPPVPGRNNYQEPQQPPTPRNNDHFQDPGPGPSLHTAPQASAQCTMVVAMYDFQTREHGLLGLSKGNTLELISDDDADWWQVRHPQTGICGYVPAQYVAYVTSLESQDWYFDVVSRTEAELLLLNPLNECGAFLIRPSTHGYSLSLKSGPDESQNTEHIKHYRIVKQNEMYSIATGMVFRTISDLIDHYRDTIRMITVPCLRVSPRMTDMSPSTRDNWEVERSLLTFDEKIGSGSFGVVYRGTYHNSTEVAVKMIKEGSMEVKQFLQEASIMKELRHPHILALYAVSTKQEPVLIITEYMSHGSLSDILPASNFTFAQQIFIAFQVASAMEYIEEKNLIHRDLAARNVLVGPSLVCKVADFGLARALTDKAYESNSKHAVKIPIKWTAPEGYLHNMFTIKSDVWSYGILLMEVMMRGAVPYPGMRKQEVIEQLQMGYRMPRPADCPEQLYEVILSCWNKSPECRPTFSSIREYMENYEVYSERSYNDEYNRQ